MPVTQSDRILYLTTPLGEHAMLLSSFSGSEGMSRLFSYQLVTVSEEEAIEAKDLVGKSVTWKVQYKDGPPRYFNGFVSRLSGGDVSPRRLRTYRVEVVPW